MFDHAKLSDPTLVQENRLPARSDHRWFATREEAEAPRSAVGGLLASPQVVSSFEQSLNGTWKFHYAVNPSEMIEGFQDPGYDTSGWARIKVPGHMQLQGYDRPQYVNTQYPWDGRQDISPGEAPKDFNPVGQYVREFNWEPRPHAEDRVILRFNGIESAGAIWLNGQYVGYTTDSFTPAEFDVTDAIVSGTNKLAVDVFKWTAGSWLEDQDFFRFSGIFRDVLLLVKPAVHIEDLTITTDLSDDLKSATVSLQVKMTGYGSVKATLAGVGPLSINEEGVFQVEVTDPHLWSPEDPFLYHLEIEVFDAEYTLTEFIIQRVGIRRFAIEDGVMKLNGERVVFRGVNRHEFGKDGRVFDRPATVRDMLLLKRAGVNAIRTSHYPNNSFFYALADKFGFMVIDEMNLETHGTWDPIVDGRWSVEAAVPGDNPQWLPAILDRAESMLERDKNHPSIVMWSSGNESYGGSNLQKVADYFRESDPTRLVHYEGISWDRRYPGSSDVESQMYTPVAKVQEFLQEHRDKPFILCEFAHAMGNSFGAVDKYVELAYQDPLYQGGFIWDFADQAVWINGDNGNGYFAFGGESGESPNDGAFCGNGIVFADRTPKPMYQELKHLYQGLKITVDESSFRVENRYLSTPSSDFKCVATLSKAGMLIAEGRVVTDVLPGHSETYKLPFTVPTDPGEYVIDVSFRLKEDTRWARTDFEVAYAQDVVVRPGASLAPNSPSILLAGAPGEEPPVALVEDLKVVNGIHNVGVHGDGFSALFSKLAGGLQSYRFGGGPEGGQELLTAVPMPNFWHAPTDNSEGWGGPAEDGQWLLASRYAIAEKGPDQPIVTTSDEGIEVTFDYLLPTTPPSKCKVTYLVTASGRVQVTMHLDPGEGLGPAPEFGMLFRTLGSFNHLTWYGEGREESSVDRRLGARLGIYQAPVDRQLTPYLRLQEAGNHTGVRWAKVTDTRGAGLMFDYQQSQNPDSVHNPSGGMDFSALPWSPFEIENADHHHQLPPSRGTFVRPALMRRGVGGDDTWGSRPHPEYLLPQGPLTFTFAFRGI